MTVNTKLVDFFFLKAPKGVGFASFLTIRDLWVPALLNWMFCRLALLLSMGRIRSGIIYSKESHYFDFHAACKSSYFIMLRFFGSWWAWGKVFPRAKTSFPFTGRTRLRFPKQQHVVVGGMAALESNHQNSRRYAGELFGWITAAPRFQVLSLNFHPHLLPLWIKLFYLPCNRTNHKARCVLVCTQALMPT